MLKDNQGGAHGLYELQKENKPHTESGRETHRSLADDI